MTTNLDNILELRRKINPNSINEIVNWKRTDAPLNIIRIHGNKDRVLPIINFKPNYLIKNGGHFMVANRAAEVSKILQYEIN